MLGAILLPTVLLPSVVQAQNGESEEPPVVDEVPAGRPRWSPPSWYMDPVEATQFEREKIRVISNLKLNSPSTAQVREIQKIAHYYLSKITHEEVRQKIPQNVTQRFHAELLQSSHRPAARAALLDEILRIIPDLLTHPDDLIRVNAVLLLTELSIEPANFQTQTPALPYTPTHRVLISILGDSQQKMECRILASRGLSRIARDDEANSLSSNERSDIAIALVGGLASVPSGKADEVWWFRYRVVEALGYVNRLDNVSGQPIVIDTLLAVLGDPDEHLLVRSQAALSVSRLPYAGSTNVQLITHEICRLIMRLSVEFEKNPRNPYWRDYFGRVYLAFRPENQQQANKNWGLTSQIRRPGLGGSSAYVEAAFERAIPIFKAILEPENPTQIPQQSLKTFQEWVAANQPSNRKVTPASADFRP